MRVSDKKKCIALLREDDNIRLVCGSSKRDILKSVLCVQNKVCKEPPSIAVIDSWDIDYMVSLGHRPTRSVVVT